jgi:small subunit ribosomal protein S8
MTTVDVPHSKIKVEIVKILEAEGFITGHEISTETKFPTIKVHLRYDAKRKSLINHIARVSKPGLRVYKPVTDLKPRRSGLTTQIISTSSGLMTDREARRRRMGGEIICEVY